MDEINKNKQEIENIHNTYSLAIKSILCDLTEEMRIRSDGMCYIILTPSVKKILRSLESLANDTPSRFL